MLGKKRGFVAAPLMGTVIFLIAVVFVVSLVKTESSEVSKIANDAYHNKLVSLLELYRSDTYALFVDGLRQNIEDWLVSPGWQNFGDIGCERTPGAQCDMPYIGGGAKAFPASPTERRDHCLQTSETITNIVSTAGASDHRYLDGLKDLLREMRLENSAGQSNPVSFEGVTFSSVTVPNALKDCSSTVAGFDNRDACKKLLPGPVMDCNYFSNPQAASNPNAPFRCCKDVAAAISAGGCPNAADQVKGCESGIFYSLVKIQDPDIYPRMPRIQVSDNFGNTIRSGALGEQDLYLPIRYPLYKYMDLSFRFYNILLHGNGNWQAEPAGASPGYDKISASAMKNRLDALCGNGLFGKLRNSQSTNPEYANISAAFSLWSPSGLPDGLVIRCTPRPGVHMGTNANADKYDSNEATLKKDLSSSGTITDYAGAQSFQITFIDHDPRNRVNVDTENKVQWTAKFKWKS